MSFLRAHLVAYAMDQAQAEIWENFIHAVVSSIRQAEQQLTTPAAWAEYCARKGALRRAKIKMGVALPRIPHEEGLTDALKHLLQDLRRASPPGSALRQFEIHFEGEAKASRLSDLGSSFG